MDKMSDKTYKHLSYYRICKCPKCRDVQLYFVGEAESLKDAGFVDEDFICNKCNEQLVQMNDDWMDDPSYVSLALISDIKDEDVVNLIREIIPRLAGAGVEDELLLKCLHIFGEFAL